MSKATESKETEMTPDERLIWLRERGVLVETSEERRIKQIKEIMNEKDESDTTSNGNQYENISFVHIPNDDSLPMKELTMNVPKDRSGSGDLLINELKPYFKALSKKVDMSLFQDQGTKTFGSSSDGNDLQVSQDALQKVAEQGQVETFCLVQPRPSNKFQSVNVYLDEVGMLKRLPLNKRVADIALRAGFNPPPKFYGDVFLGRVTTNPVLQNLNFKLGQDTSPDAKWMNNATMENLEYQVEMNKITGKSTNNNNNIQPSADGENGIAKVEQNGLYSWTQTDEEVEITLPLPVDDDSIKVLSSRDVKAGSLNVKYFPRKISVTFRGKDVLNLSLFDSIDPDGCAWTLDIGNVDDNNGNGKPTCLVITCEKNDAMSWPRITT